MLLTIIVPVYNALPYLRECLDSILRQTVPDFEVILVDDGSTDGSGTICDEYTNKDSRFRTYHIENGGAGRARNVGIVDAKGEWISFVDADDTIVENYVQTFYEIKNKADVTFFGMEYCYSNGSSCCRIPNKCYADKRSDIEEIIKELLYGDGGSCFGWTCNKFFKYRIIKDYNVHFFEAISICEDLIFAMDYCRYIQSIQVIDNILYRYRINNAGLMHAGMQRGAYILLSEKVIDSLPYYNNEELINKEKKEILEYRIKDMWSNYRFVNIHNVIRPLFDFLKYNPEYKQYKKDFQIISILSHSFILSYILFCLYIIVTSIRNLLK